MLHVRPQYCHCCVNNFHIALSNELKHFWAMHKLHTYVWLLNCMRGLLCMASTLPATNVALQMQVVACVLNICLLLFCWCACLCGSHRATRPWSCWFVPHETCNEQLQVEQNLHNKSLCVKLGASTGWLLSCKPPQLLCNKTATVHIAFDDQMWVKVCNMHQCLYTCCMIRQSNKRLAVVEQILVLLCVFKQRFNW